MDIDICLPPIQIRNAQSVNTNTQPLGSGVTLQKVFTTQHTYLPTQSSQHKIGQNQHITPRKWLLYRIKFSSHNIYPHSSSQHKISQNQNITPRKWLLYRIKFSPHNIYIYIIPLPTQVHNTKSVQNNQRKTPGRWLLYRRKRFSLHKTSVSPHLNLKQGQCKIRQNQRT